MDLLPESLAERIDTLAASVSFAALEKATQQLMGRYAKGQSECTGRMMQSLEEKIAYLIFRLPATFSALKTVFQELNSRMGEVSIERMLDLGSGPATSIWAALETFERLKFACAIEQDTQLINIAKQLFGMTPSTHCPQHIFGDLNIEWVAQDLTASSSLSQCDVAQPWDLIVASYSLGELSDHALLQVLDDCCSLACRFFVLIEPGTPRGFSTVLRARDFFREKKWNIVAPCTHQGMCPMSEKSDWCHFYTRLSRVSLQRRLKKGSLGWEDEKFSYLIVASPLVPYEQENNVARIVRHPCVRSGHVHLTLCSQYGLSTPIVSKRQSEQYRLAKKVSWGDTWPVSGES